MNIDYLAKVIENQLNEIATQIDEDADNFDPLMPYLRDTLDVAERIAKIQQLQQQPVVQHSPLVIGGLPDVKGTPTETVQPEPKEEEPKTSFTFPGNVRIPEGRSSYTPKPAMGKPKADVPQQPQQVYQQQQQQPYAGNYNTQPSNVAPMPDVWGDSGNDHNSTNHLTQNDYHSLPSRQDYQRPYPVPNNNTLTRDERNQEAQVNQSVQSPEQLVAYQNGQYPVPVEYYNQPEPPVQQVKRIPQQRQQPMGQQYVETMNGQPVMGRVIIQRGSTMMSPLEQMMSDIISAAGIPPIIPPPDMFY